MQCRRKKTFRVFLPAAPFFLAMMRKSVIANCRIFKIQEVPYGTHRRRDRLSRCHYP